MSQTLSFLLSKFFRIFFFFFISVNSQRFLYWISLLHISHTLWDLITIFLVYLSLYLIRIPIWFYTKGLHYSMDLWITVNWWPLPTAACLYDVFHFWILDLWQCQRLVIELYKSAVYFNYIHIQQLYFYLHLRCTV